MSHLLSSIASIWFMSLNRGPSILERPLNEPIQSFHVFPHPFPQPCCCPNPTCICYRAWSSSRSSCRWNFVFRCFFQKKPTFSMQRNIDSLATILQTALLLTVQALPGEGLHHKMSQRSTPLSCSFCKNLFPKPSSTTLMESATFFKSKNKLCLQFFPLPVQIFVLSFSLSQTTSNYHGWLSTGTFSSAEKSSQGMRVAPRLPGKGQRPTNPPAMTPTESCLVKTLSVLEGFFILSFLVGGFNPSDKY